MSMKEEMRKYEEQEDFIKAVFTDDTVSIEANNISPEETLALAMALLEKSVEDDEMETIIVLAEFIKDQLEGKEND